MIQGRDKDLLLQLGVVAIEKGAFESPLTSVTNFINNLQYRIYNNVVYTFVHVWFV